MKSLYVSDLDGTLLNRDGELSHETVRRINLLLDRGLNFTVATARTASTALQIVSPLHLALPVIFMNGVAVYDMVKRTYVYAHQFSQAQILQAFTVLNQTQQKSFVYSVQDNQLICYSLPDLPESMQNFRQNREMHYQKKFTNISGYHELVQQKIIYFLLIGSYNDLEETYRAMSAIEGLDCLFYQDVYSADWLLEIHRTGVSKGTAARGIAEAIGADELVVFGDNINDLPLFAAADYAFAVGNSHPDILQSADQVIGTNEENAVALELEKICLYNMILDPKPR